MAAGLRRGDFTSVELTNAHLDRIELTDHALHAWVWWSRDLALEQARAADARIASAPDKEALPALLGVPVALKDLVLTRGDAATAGSAILKGYVSPYDAHIAERLHEAGAVLPGKTNMDEFAMGSSTEFSCLRADGQPVGPRSRAGRQQRWLCRGRGGLPGAAVHRHGHGWLDPPAGRADGHRGAQTHLRPRQPLRHRRLCLSLDQIGPFARDVRDAALLLGVMAGRDERDSTSAPCRCRTTWRRCPTATMRPRRASGACAWACRGSTSSMAWSRASSSSSARRSQR